MLLCLADTEEHSEIGEPDVHGPEQPALGLELAGAMDGIEAVGEPKRGRVATRPSLNKELRSVPARAEAGEQSLAPAPPLALGLVGDRDNADPEGRRF